MDAALYWLARMLKAGEDPRFIMRRLLILASEDIGLADPRALLQVVAASRALDWVGLPEGRVPPGPGHHVPGPGPQEQLHPAYFRAKAALEDQGATRVPTPLQDASPGREGPGARPGYLYPHDFPGHWVDQAYLPAELAGRASITGDGRGGAGVGGPLAAPD